MDKPPQEKSSPHDLQIKALCDALDCASRAAKNSDAVAFQARIEVQSERKRNLHASNELRRISGELEHLLEENKRLRRAIGELYKERETLTERIRQLTTTPPAPALRVVKNASVGSLYRTSHGADRPSIAAPLATPPLAPAADTSPAPENPLSEEPASVPPVEETGSVPPIAPSPTSVAPSARLTLPSPPLAAALAASLLRISPDDKMAPSDFSTSVPPSTAGRLQAATPSRDSEGTLGGRLRLVPPPSCA